MTDAADRLTLADGTRPQPVDAPETTIDRLFDGRIVLRQFRRGHRVGTDAVLLATETIGPIGGMVVDVGAGVGAVGIAIAVRNPGTRLILVENDPATAALARDNLDLNGLSGRATVVEVDVMNAAARCAAGLNPGIAALVVSNPPFHMASRVRTSPDVGRRRAHVMDAHRAGTPALGTGDPDAAPSLTTWVRACVVLTAAKGQFAMIHRPEALAEIMLGVEGRAGAVCITPVSPRRDRNATRILVRALKDSRAPLSITPPLVLHGDDGRFTAEAEARHRPA